MGVTGMGCGLWEPKKNSSPWLVWIQEPDSHRLSLQHISMRVFHVQCSFGCVLAQFLTAEASVFCCVQKAIWKP